MANEVRIKKTVYNKEQFKKVVDNEFKTFIQPIVLDSDLTIEEFFDFEEDDFYVVKNKIVQNQPDIEKRKVSELSINKSLSYLKIKNINEEKFMFIECIKK